MPKPVIDSAGFHLADTAKRLGISTIQWDYSVFCGHLLGMPHGMME